MEIREDITIQSFHLPNEMLLQILIRLPSKSIFKFKCVCRNWLYLISDPSFFHDFVSRLNDSPPFAIVFQCWKRIGIRWLESAEKTDRSSSFCFQFPFDQIPGLKVDATSNDLILYRSSCQESAYSVANPFTGQSVQLPMHGSKKSHPSTGLVSYVRNGIMSFNVARVIKDSCNDEHRSFNLQIFSSWTREWRNFELRNQTFDVEIDTKPCIVFNGNLHWVSNKMTALLVYNPYCCSPSFSRLIRVPNRAYYMNGANAILGVSGKNMYYFEMSGICMRDRKLPGWKLWRMRDYETGEWSLDRKRDNAGNESKMSVVWIVLSRHSPVFPVAFHPWNEGVVYFWCDGYMLKFDVEKGWFDDEFLVSCSAKMDSAVEIFPLSMPFCSTQVSDRHINY